MGLDRATIPSLGAGDTIDVEFSSWIPGPSGNIYLLTSFTDLAIDANRVNDTCKSKTRTIVGFDVGIDAIYAPSDTMNSGDTTIPSCLVTNYGLMPATDVGVACNISRDGNSVYYDSTHFDIDISLSKIAEFKSWTPTEPGFYEVLFRASLEGDEYEGNNIMSKSVLVVGEVACLDLA